MDRRNTMACAGCLLSAVGTITATLLWASSARTERHLGGGFEGEGSDYSVLWTELPLVALAGAVLPALCCGLVAWLTTGTVAGRRGRDR